MNKTEYDTLVKLLNTEKDIENSLVDKEISLAKELKRVKEQLVKQTNMVGYLRNYIDSVPQPIKD